MVLIIQVKLLSCVCVCGRKSDANGLGIIFLKLVA